MEFLHGHPRRPFRCTLGRFAVGGRLGDRAEQGVGVPCGNRPLPGATVVLGQGPEMNADVVGFRQVEIVVDGEGLTPVSAGVVQVGRPSA